MSYFVYVPQAQSLPDPNPVYVLYSSQELHDALGEVIVISVSTCFQSHRVNGQRNHPLTIRVSKLVNPPRGLMLLDTLKTDVNTDLLSDGQVRVSIS